MQFQAAYSYLKRGHDIALPEWGGFWRWDKANATIQMHCRNGNVIDMRDSTDMDYTISFMFRDDWELVKDASKTEWAAAYQTIVNEVLPMSDNDQLEKAIQSKGLNAPRLSPADIDAVIMGETFTTLPSGKVMICEMTLRNGFTVRGQAATVSKENFDEGIGQTISRADAYDKVWELEGYLLQQRLHEARITGDLPPHQQRLVAERDDLAVKAAALSAFIGGNPILTTLPQDERVRLREQCELMWRYYEVLDERITAFVDAPKESPEDKV